MREADFQLEESEPLRMCRFDRFQRATRVDTAGIDFDLALFAAQISLQGQALFTCGKVMHSTINTGDRLGQRARLTCLLGQNTGLVC